MTHPPIEIFADIVIPPEIENLPKADIHVHAEWSPRLDRVLSKRAGRAPYKWQTWAENLMYSRSAGEDRLSQISEYFPATQADDAVPENFVGRVVDLLEEGARDGAILVEVRFGKDLADRPNCLHLFREAEKQVQAKFPDFHAGVIPFIYLNWGEEKLERIVQRYEKWGREGLLFGADIFNDPYGQEADWTRAYQIGERLANAGLGITIHVAETAPVNIESALKMPGLTRIGHATHAGYHPHLLEKVAESGITVEVPLTCNVILGATESYESHPIRKFVSAGIPVTLCTDDPVQMCTTIGREYAIAHQLGFSVDTLRGFTRNALEVAFIPPETRAQLLEKLQANA